MNTMSERCAERLVRKAISYRRKSSRAGGVVILYRGKVAGWMDELRDPQGWCPGAVAVSDAGECWVARGGDDYNGAHEWHRQGDA